MLKRKNLIWHDPLKLAFTVSRNINYQENWAFLYSGLAKINPDSYSYLALYPQKQIISDNFKEFDEALQDKDKKWFGYLGYDLKNHLEKLQADEDSFINLPNLWMINYGLVLEFDHSKKQISCYYQNEDLLHKIPLPLCKSSSSSQPPHSSSQPPHSSSQRKLGSQHGERDPSLRWDDAMSCYDGTAWNGEVNLDKGKNYDNKSYWNVKVSSIKSNFNKNSYFKKLASIQSKITRGDLYQANLTRKFFGKFIKSPKNNFDLFLKLNKASPANYSAFLKLDKNYIISSSPELFLSIDQNNQVISRPIKGTAPRFSNPKLDSLSKNNLKKSVKEKAENLMIVDLVRNDLSRNCLVNSVLVKDLFKISSYKNVHHMSSEIIGIKDKKYSHLDLVKSCFPPASMTGTPKIKAMEVCSIAEKKRRGVYSGAIGFFAGRDICKLSVVIRTIIIQEKKFEFQVGGAITYDSKPDKEWQETINKAKGVAFALGIKLKKIRKL